MRVALVEGWDSNRRLAPGTQENQEKGFIVSWLPGFLMDQPLLFHPLPSQFVGTIGRAVTPNELRQQRMTPLLAGAALGIGADLRVVPHPPEYQGSIASHGAPTGTL